MARRYARTKKYGTKKNTAFFLKRNMTNVKALARICEKDLCWTRATNICPSSQLVVVFFAPKHDGQMSKLREGMIDNGRRRRPWLWGIRRERDPVVEGGKKRGAKEAEGGAPGKVTFRRKLSWVPRSDGRPRRTEGFLHVQNGVVSRGRVC